MPAIAPGLARECYPGSGASVTMIVFSLTEGILDVMIDPRQRIQVNAIRAGLARHFGRHERARSRPLTPTRLFIC